MKTAIVYYSMCGNTAYVAEKLRNALGADADIIEIIPVKTYPSKGFRKFLWGGKSAVMAETPELQPYEFNADNYERVVIGFPVWASRFAPPVRTFVEENKEALQSKKISAYACQSGSGAEKALSGLKELIGISEFNTTAILIDPKDKPAEEKDNQIKGFCAELAEEKQ